jgi:hypothetical protein
MWDRVRTVVIVVITAVLATVVLLYALDYPGLPSIKTPSSPWH